MPSSAFTKPQMHGFLAKLLRFHIVGVIIVTLGVQLSKKLLWLNQKRKYMQVSTEIMIQNLMTDFEEMRKAGILQSTK